MTRPLPFLTTLFLLCVINIHAHVALTTYRFGSNTEPDNATAFSATIHPVLNTCTQLNSEGYESSFGIWIDGGDNCARSNSFPNSGNWSVQLRNGIGITSSIFTQNQNFVGMAVNISFSYYPQGYETGEGFVLEYATDGGTIYTGHSAWVRGNHFENNTRNNVSINLTGMTWTSQSRLRLRSVGSTNDDLVYIDDVVISDCCDIGASCNDNSQCTTGDVIDANCECHGAFQDADSDGTCDAFDICPGVDDYLIISEAPCDDGDPCTQGDHMDSDVCGCQGQYVDWDQDGLCANDDPNDLDACNPDPENPACNPCTTHDNAHFESNYNIWNSGGNDATRVYAPQYANAGNYCVRLRDNTGSVSAIHTNNINLAGLNNVSVAFSFYAVSMEVNEDFLLEVSTNGGASYAIYETWSRGPDFQNNSRVYVFVPVNGITWTNQTRFRIRCDASANDDAVYIDDIIIRSCLNYPAMQAPEVVVNPVISNEGPSFIADTKDVIVTPNPVATELQLSGMPLDEAIIDVINLAGSQVQYARLNDNTLDVSRLLPGLYFVRIEIDGQVMVKRFVKE